MESISLRFSATNLSSKRSILVLYEKIDEVFKEISRSELISFTNNPQYDTEFHLEFDFTQRKKFFINFFSEEELLDLSLFAKSEFILGEAIRSKRLEVPIISVPRQESIRTTLLISTRPEGSNNLKIKMKCKAEDLKKQFRGAPCPYLVIFNSNNLEILRTEQVFQESSPTWHTIQVNSFELGESHSSIFTFQIYDKRNGEQEKLIGQVESSIEELLTFNQSDIIKLPLKTLKKKKNVGNLLISQFRTSNLQSFSSLISSGRSILPIFAIDFSISNGRMEFPNSLHYRNPPELNQYEQCISLIGEVLSQYSENEWPCFGFAGKINRTTSNISSNCFPLNSDRINPECNGISGVLEAYSNALNFVTLHGPSALRFVIRGVIGLSQKVDNHIALVIIFHSIPSDLSAIKELLNERNSNRISIILIGVGDRDWSLINKESWANFSEFKILKKKGKEEFLKQSLKGLEIKATAQWN